MTSDSICHLLNMEEQNCFFENSFFCFVFEHSLTGKCVKEEAQGHDAVLIGKSSIHHIS